MSLLFSYLCQCGINNWFLIAIRGDFSNGIKLEDLGHQIKSKIKN